MQYISSVVKHKISPLRYLFSHIGWKESLKLAYHETIVGGAVASRLVRSTPDRAVRFPAQDGNITLCPWARHLILSVPLFTQVYK